MLSQLYQILSKSPPPVIISVSADRIKGVWGKSQQFDIFCVFNSVNEIKFFQVLKSYMCC